MNIKNDKKTCQKVLTTILVMCILWIDKESCQDENETCQTIIQIIKTIVINN